MKKAIKIISVILTVIMFFSVFSAANPVIAAEVQEISEAEAATQENSTSEVTESDSAETETATEEAITQTTESEPEILGEIEELRTETTKYFRQSDGSYLAAQYAYPVHYMENGVWKEIDNTLSEETVEENLFGKEKEYVANKTSTPVRFPDEFKKDGSKEISVNIKGYEISFSPKEAQSGLRDSNGRITDAKNLLSTEIVNGEKNTDDKLKTSKLTKESYDEKTKVTNMNGAVVYEEVFSDVDIEYEINSSTLKESIVLNKKQNKNTFEFVMDLGSLIPKKEADGSIVLYSNNDFTEAVSVIMPPYMLDSKGAYSDSVTMSLIRNGEEYVLSVVADEDWLNDEKRAYPVIIDPTINLEIDRKNVIDNYVDTREPNEPHPYAYNSYVGYNSLGTARTYIKFNLPDLPEDNYMITNAYIAFWQKSTDTNGTQGYINIHEVTEDWNNTDSDKLPTWENKPEYDDTVLDYAKIEFNENDECRCYSFDITRTVKSWYEGADNYGLMLKSSDESVVNRVELFAAEEYNTEGYPAIYVTFKDNKGLENYWSYSGFSIGAAGTAYVNDYTGNLVYAMPIVSSSGTILPIEITAYFNNYCSEIKYTVGKNYSSQTSPGKGFRLNYQQTVLPSTEYEILSDSQKSNYPYVYTDGDGTEHYFQEVEEDGKTIYKDEDGLGLVLTTDCDLVATYQITAKDGMNYYFNSKGNLGIIKDPNGNRITISYKPANENGLEAKTRIAYITDGSGHKYTFSYYDNSDGTEGAYIKAITDNAGRKVEFTTSGGHLREVSKYDETKTQIEYKTGDDNPIVYIQSNGIYRLAFEYTSKSLGARINKIEEFGVQESTDENNNTVYNTYKGQVVTFDRSKYNTTIIRSCGVDGKHYIDDSSCGNDDIITTMQFDNAGRTTSQLLKYGSGSAISAGSVEYTSDTGDTTTSGFKNRVGSNGGIGKSIVNLLSNGNAESLSGWSNTKMGDVTYTANYTSAFQYMGASSLVLENTLISSENSRSYFRQSYTNLITGDYTLSAYVKTEDLVAYSSTNRTGAYVQLIAYNSSGDSVASSVSAVLFENTDSNINNGWHRLSATIAITEDVASLCAYLVLNNSKGKAYFDCIQLEKGSTVNSYNMLENSSFEKYDAEANKPNSWTGVSNMYDSSADGISDAHRQGSKSVKIVGASNVSKGISQTLNVQGNPRDTYIVGGWAKGLPINTTFHTTGSGENIKGTALFEIAVKVTYNKTDESGNSEQVTQYKNSAKFNTTITDWQYASTPIVLKYTDGETGYTYTPTKITIMPRFNKQENYVCFDHLMLVKDVASSYTYDKDGNLVSSASNSEQQYNMEYDDDNNLTSYTDAANNKTTAKYDDKRNILSSTSPKKVHTEYTYNDVGLLRTTEVHNGSLYSVSDSSDNYSAATMAIKTGQTYFADDTTTTINEGAYFNASYDDNKRKTSYTYNFDTGSLLTTTDPNGVVTTNKYGSTYGKLQSTTIGNSRVAYTYDSANRITDIKFGKVTDNEFDANLYETYTLGYDKYGNKNKTYVGSQALSTKDYSNNGILNSITYGNYDVKRYTYNKLGLVTSEYGTNNVSDDTNEYENYSWTYNTSGRALSHTDHVNNQKYLFGYDSLGRLIRQEVQNKEKSTYIGATEYCYDVKNNLTKLLTNYGEVSHNQRYYYSQTSLNANSAKYAKDNLPTAYKLYSTRYAVYDYDDLNRLTQRKFTTEIPLYYNYTYKSSARNTDTNTIYTTNNIDTEFIGNNAYTYTYGNRGNITGITKGTRSGNADNATTYTNASAYRSYSYDDLGQLTKEKIPESNLTQTWTYDDMGNITEKKEYDYETGALTKAVSYTYGASSNTGWNNLLLSVDFNGDGKPSTTEEITYDKIGNPKTYFNSTMTWYGRQLVSCNLGTKTADTTDDKAITYTYDADGLRATKTVDNSTSEYVYVNGQLHYEKRGDGNTLYYFYDSNGYLSGIQLNGTNYYPATNLQGDVVAIYNYSGNLLATYEYDAWGNILSVKNASGTELTEEKNPGHIAIINPIRYRGYYYDAETGFYYLQSRYYDAKVGRFINADGALNGNGDMIGFNMFAYCSNNPVMFTDPNGCGLWEFLKGLWNDAKKKYNEYKKSKNTKPEFEPTGSYNNGKSNVYIVKETDVENIMKSKEDDAVVIVDKRNSSDPNMQIKESYKINKQSQQKEIAQVMLDYNDANPVSPAWSRSQNSIIEEWKIHNIAYSFGYKRDRTGDCDFNNADENKGVWDFVGR